MKNILVHALSAVLLVSFSSVAYSDDLMGSADKYFSKAKMKDIESNDFPAQAARLKKETGKEVKISADWKSFERASFDASEFLGSTNMDVIRFVVNADASKKKAFGDKVKTILYRHSPAQASPSITLSKGTLMILGNYEHLNWKSDAGPTAQMTAAIK